MKLKSLILILFLLFPATAFAQFDEPLELILFVSQHCKPCQEFKERILPQIKEKYRDKIRINELDFDQPQNVVRLLDLQDKYNWHPEENKTPTVFIDGKFLVGTEDLERYLAIYIDTALSERGSRPIPKTDSPTSDLVSRFKLIRPLGVISAGLIDGINPCAFTVIIFFISFLTLQGYGRRKILTIGLSFILAVFITYVLIGVGLFNFLYKLKTYWIIVKIIYTAGAILCFSLAGFAFYDFVKFRKTGQTQGLTLQLPEGLKQRIHWIIGLHYRQRDPRQEMDTKSSTLRLILSAFLVGFLVSLFEAVCTGQVYLPTIVFVLKSTQLKLRALSYLLLYNLMFVIPLWIIMLFALWGVSSQQFAKLVQKHMGTIKILMVVLFLGLGVFLIWQ
ncbi:MAG: cytochrome c biogenesis protein [Candidatus Omnitrophota bacterium]|jgi:cytochrome c biogenesis protein CcdA